jgi:hypothetical protein
VSVYWAFLDTRTQLTARSTDAPFFLQTQLNGRIQMLFPAALAFFCRARSSARCAFSHGP